MVCQLGQAAKLGWDFYLTCVILLIPPLLAAAGLLYGLRLLIKPGANRKCALSLLAAIVAWAVLVGGLLLIILMDPRRRHEGPDLRTTIALGAFLPGIAGLVLGIIGLDQLARSPHRYSHGRKAVVLAIILSALVNAVIGLLMFRIHGGVISTSWILGAGGVDPGRSTPLVADRIRGTRGRRPLPGSRSTGPADDSGSLNACTRNARSSC